MDADPGHDLRCSCSRRPLLAKYGRDSTGLLYVHLKVYKQRKLYAEAIFTSGTVRLKCRECLHWNNVKIIQPTGVRVKQASLPDEILVSMLADPTPR